MKNQTQQPALKKVISIFLTTPHQKGSHYLHSPLHHLAPHKVKLAPSLPPGAFPSLPPTPRLVPQNVSFYAQTWGWIVKVSGADPASSPPSSPSPWVLIFLEAVWLAGIHWKQVEFMVPCGTPNVMAKENSTPCPTRTHRELDTRQRWKLS